MESMCSENSIEQATCCCACNFPLPQFCEKHLSEHRTKPGHHFTLPLTASSKILSLQVYFQAQDWLDRLTRKHNALRMTFTKFSAKGEKINDVCDELKAHVTEVSTRLKTEFSVVQAQFYAAVESAIKETSVRALDYFVPQDPFSWLLWNYEPSDIISDQLYTFQALSGKERLDSAFQIALQFTLPGLENWKVGAPTQSQSEDKEPHHREAEVQTEEVNQELRQQLQSAQLEIESFRRDKDQCLSALQNEYDQMKVKTDDLEMKYQQKDKELEAARQNIAAKDKELEAARQNIAAKDKELEAARQNIAAKDKELEAARQNIAAKDKELEAARQNIAAKDKELEAARQNIAAKDKELEAARQNIAAKDKELEAARQNIAAKDKELEAARQNIAAKDKELEAARQNIAAKDKELEAARQNIAAKDKELEAARQNIAGKAKELEAARQNIAAKDKELEAARQNIAAKDKELEAARQNIAAKDKELEAARQNIAAKDKELEAARQNIAGKAKELEAARQNIAGKDKELEAANGKVSTLEKEKSSLVSQVKAKTDELARTQKELETKKNELQDKDRRISTLEKDLASATSLVKEKDSQIATLTAANSELATTAQRCSELEKEIAGLNKQTTELKTQASELQARLGRAQEECANAYRQHQWQIQGIVEQLQYPTSERSQKLIAVLQDQVKVFNVATRQWQQLLALRQNIQVDIGTSSTFIASNRIFVCGGGPGPRTRHVDNRAYMLEGDGSARELPLMSTGRFYHGVAWDSVRQALYVFGGLNGRGTCYTGDLRASEMFLSEWSPLPDMHKARAYFNPCWHSSIVYLCGGVTNSVETYDPRSNTFVLQDFTLPESSQTTAVVENGTLTVISRNYISKLQQGRLTSQKHPNYMPWSNCTPLVSGGVVYVVSLFNSCCRCIDLTTGVVQKEVSLS